MASPLDHGDVAAWLTGLAVAALGAWKAFFHIRKDSRDDHADARHQRSEDTVDHTYTELVNRLLGEVARLSSVVAAVVAETETERSARREAEEHAASANRRAATAEDRATEAESRATIAEAMARSLAERISVLEKYIAEIRAQARLSNIGGDEV